jgi:hypothetical protein
MPAIGLPGTPGGSVLAPIGTGTGSSTPEIKVVKYEIPTELTNFTNHLTEILRVNNSINSIDTVAGAMTSIDNVLAKVNVIEKVSNSVDNIDTLATMKDTMVTLKDNLQVLKDTLDQIPLLQEIKNKKEVLDVIYAFRESFVNCSEDEEIFRTLYNNLDQIKGVYADISNIDIVYKHLLAIEIVARGIKILEVFTANLETYKSLLEMKDDLKVIVANMADVVKAIEVYKDLPNKIAEFKSDLENTIAQANKAIEDKANDMLGQIAHALLPLENALMKMQVDMSNFKLDVNTKLTEMANSFSEKLLALKTEKDKELEAIKAEMLHIKETYIGHQIINNVTTTNTETTNVTKDVKATTKNEVTANTTATNTTTATTKNEVTENTTATNTTTATTKNDVTSNTTNTTTATTKNDVTNNVTETKTTTATVNGDIKADIVANVTGKGGTTPTPSEDEGNGAEI